MSCVVEHSLPILEILYICSTKSYYSLLEDKKLSKILALALVEIAHNVLYYEFPFTKEERSSLRKHIVFIRKIAANKSAKTSKVRSRKLLIVAKNRPALKVLLFPVLKGSLKELCRSKSST